MMNPMTKSKYQTPMTTGSSAFAPSFYHRLLIAVLLIVLGTGCTAERRKSRLSRRADDHFKAGEYNNAKIEYLGLLRLDAENKTAFERLGTIWAEQGAPLRAAPFLLKARDLSPSNVENRIRLARVFLAWETRLPRERKRCRFSPLRLGNEDAIVVLSESDRTKEEVADTEGHLKKFLDHNKASYYLALANVEFHKQNFAAAKSALQRASELDPKSSTPHLALAALFCYQGERSRRGRNEESCRSLPPRCDLTCATRGIQSAKRCDRRGKADPEGSHRQGSSFPSCLAAFRKNRSIGKALRRSQFAPRKCF